jgi:hypothetical protein
MRVSEDFISKKNGRLLILKQFNYAIENDNLALWWMAPNLIPTVGRREWRNYGNFTSP